MFCKLNAISFSAILFLHRYSQNLTVVFDLKYFCEVSTSEKLTGICKKTVFCENSRNQSTGIVLVRHKRRFSTGSFSFAECPVFSTRSHADVSFRLAKTQSLDF